MVEYVEKEATIKRIKEVYCVGCNSYHGVRCRACGTGDAIDMIEDAPAADVAPVVHGRWVPTKAPFMNECEDCSVCGYRTVWGHRYNYCPNCGAKMDGGDNDEADSTYLQDAIGRNAFKTRDDISVCPSGGHHDYRMVAIGSDEVGDCVNTYRCSKCGEEFKVKFVT